MTKEELRQYRSKKAELEELNRLMQVKTLNTSNNLMQLYDSKRCKLLNDLYRVEQVIDALDSVERRLMRLRYIEGLEWHQVAARIHYSLQHTHRLHAQVLIKIKNL